MRRFVSVALATSALCVSVPSAAEGPTAEDNLDCAVVTAIAGGQGKDEGAKSGLGILLAYFAGLYEGQTGKNIDDVLPARLGAMTVSEINKASGTCQARAKAFSERLTNLGQRLIAQGS